MEWRLTATTLFCQEVKKWVPVVVYKEGKISCGFFRRQEGEKKNGRVLPCSGPQDCSLCQAYREDVFQRNDPMPEGKEGGYEEKLST